MSSKKAALISIILIWCINHQVLAQRIESNPGNEINPQAIAGDAVSLNALGLKYAQGIGVTKNGEEAAKCFRKAAELNLAPAQYNLGRIYYDGEFIAKNSIEAVKWFQKAADQNQPNAQEILGTCYFIGDGVTKNTGEAVKWYRRAADQNHANAQCYLGTCYFQGEGVKKNLAEAVKWYRRAAEQNHALAQFNLGSCYYSGQGVKKDFVESVKWFRMAAEQNYAYAQYALGNCYYSGQGLKKDYAEAAKWCRRAAEQNYAPAQSGLGNCYASGQGVIKDYIEAYKWFLLAAGQGEETSKKSISALEARMTREQIADGQKLARDFKPRLALDTGRSTMTDQITDSQPIASGTGFFITEDGFLITNQHVIAGASRVRLYTSSGLIPAKVVKVDESNDLALLKADGKFMALPITTSRSVELGSSVSTIGFPNIELQASRQS